MLHPVAHELPRNIFETYNTREFQHLCIPYEVSSVFCACFQINDNEPHWLFAVKLPDFHILLRLRHHLDDLSIDVLQSKHNSFPEPTLCSTLHKADPELCNAAVEIFSRLRSFKGRRGKVRESALVRVMA